MNWDIIRKNMEENSYPPNQSYDPERIEELRFNNKRMYVIAQLFPLLCERDRFKSLLDVGCNKGLFSFSFKDAFKEIVGIDPIGPIIDIANKIKQEYALNHISFFRLPFEDYYIEDQFDVIHFGQCAHYLFRDAVRNHIPPLSFLDKAKNLAKKFILIDGAFDGDPSVEFDAKTDNWLASIKEAATIEGYAKALRPEFRLIKFGWSGDGATRFLAVFEKTL